LNHIEHEGHKESGLARRICGGEAGGGANLIPTVAFRPAKGRFFRSAKTSTFAGAKGDKRANTMFRAKHSRRIGIESPFARAKVCSFTPQSFELNFTVYFEETHLGFGFRSCAISPLDTICNVARIIAVAMVREFAH